MVLDCNWREEIKKKMEKLSQLIVALQPLPGRLKCEEG
jgi:hypothetical protein